VVEQDIKIGKDVFIAMGGRILPGVEIGDGAVIGAGSLVRKNVPAWTVVFGLPAKPIGHREKVKYPDPD
jgi:acetyltransferase-like isoleucine patch superfamily enzyme